MQDVAKPAAMKTESVGCLNPNKLQHNFTLQASSSVEPTSPAGTRGARLTAVLAVLQTIAA